MKWIAHVIAAAAGLVLAALIVFLVFGSASEQAAQQGAAPSSVTGAAAGASTGSTRCGTVPVARLADAATIRTSASNLPAILLPTGMPAEPRDPAQRRWFARLGAAGGLCVDTVTVGAGTVVELSTVDGVDAGEADAFTTGVIAVAFQPPLNRPRVRVTTRIGTETRTVAVSERAWRAFQSQRAALGLANGMGGLAAFRRTTAFPAADLQITGWQPTT